MPSQPGSLGHNHEFVCVATVHVSKDEDDFKRAIQNMEVRKIETIFVTVQAQISNLKNRDSEIHGLEEK